MHETTDQLKGSAVFRRTASLVMLLTTTLLAGPLEAAGAATEQDAATVVGVCTFGVVTAPVLVTTSLQMVPGTATTLTFEGDGRCTTNDPSLTGTPPVSTGDGSLSGEVSSITGLPTLTCLGGVASGEGSFSIPGITTNAIEFTVVLVVVGAVVVMTLASTSSPFFLGTGVFLQDPITTTTCPRTGTSWSGVIVFGAPSA
jgi:hypothetical protein